MTNESVPMGCEGLRPRWYQSTLNDIKRLGLPEPDHKYGFSNKLLKTVLKASEMVKFQNWMAGQTCMVDDKLGLINYTHDVIRGLAFIRHGTPTYFD